MLWKFYLPVDVRFGTELSPAHRTATSQTEKSLDELPSPVLLQAMRPSTPAKFRLPQCAGVSWLAPWLSAASFRSLKMS